jgi:AbrB family looped-hinge helix DNA binding protein
MSSTKLSSNYQIVVPKDVRKKLKLVKGQLLYVKSIDDNSVSFTTKSPVDVYYGLLRSELDKDAVRYQKQLRKDRTLPSL